MKKLTRLILSITVLLCLMCCFCSCGEDVNTNDTSAPTIASTETVATTEATVATTEETKATETQTQASVEISEEDAIQMVKDTYKFGEGYSYSVRDVEEIDGVRYYGVDLRKIMDTHTTYLTTYFVKTDGSQIVEGYYQNDEPTLVE